MIGVNLQIATASGEPYPPGHVGRFNEAKTEHFLIRHDVPDEYIESIGERLEHAFRLVWRFLEDLKLRPRPPDEPLRVHLFQRAEAFNAYLESVGVAPASVAGIYDQRSNTAAFFAPFERMSRDGRSSSDSNRSASSASANGVSPAPSVPGNSIVPIPSSDMDRDAGSRRVGRRIWFVLQHETTHQVLFNTGLFHRESPIPAWLNEGLACLFEAAAPDAREGEALSNRPRLRDLRAALRLDEQSTLTLSELLRSAEDSGRIVPLAQLVGDGGLRDPRDAHAAFHYAQCWSFVHHLHQRHREGFAEYLRILSRREPGTRVPRHREISDFESAIAPLDTALEMDWVTYAEALSMAK